MPDGAADLSGSRIEPVGDAALLLTVGDDVAAHLNALVHRVVAGLAPEVSGVPGLGVPVPAYASVLVPFDPDLVSEEMAREAVARALERAMDAPPPEPGPLVEVEVAYGGTDGPDLVEVARRIGRTEADVVALHAGSEYRVFLVGFVPGFPYLGILPDELVLPRRATPRTRVPAGSVAIAGRQTGIYPFATPGGWHLIGRTHAQLWDPRRSSPALLAPGARVRFVPV